MSVRTRIRRDERGATLILAIAFLVVVGSITAATLSFVTSGINDRGILDTVRDRQYAADAAVESAIAQTRAATADQGTDVCITLDAFTLKTLTIHVDCTNAPVLTTGLLLQRNAIFSACQGTATCTPATTIVRAQVNFEGDIGDPTTRTWVQSWSVNQ
jgi:hypothetical protein